MSGAQNLSLLRDAVVTSLRAKIPGVKSIEPHGGTFDEAEIKRFAFVASAIRVAVMGFDTAGRHATGQLRLPVHFSAVVVTRDATPDGVKVDRDVSALLIANAVALAVAGNRFGLEGVFQPENLRGANEYSAVVQGAGLAMWQVTWTTPVLLGETIDEAIGALTQLFVNGVLFADPAPTAADPLRDPPAGGAP
jgi:hypothetical protein